MPVRISNLPLPIDQPEETLPAVFARVLGVRADSISQWRILRKSLDARNRHSLKFVYSAVVDLTDAEPKAKRSEAVVEQYSPPLFEEPLPGTTPLPERPVIVGSGPAGILAAWYLALKGYRPLVLERGDPVKLRVPAIRDFDKGGPLDPESNYLFGEGGAGTFSDGKLTCRMSGPDIDWVLEQFIECGGKSEIRYEHRPHLGSNRLPMLVRNFRRKIEALGGEYKFRCRMEGLKLSDGRVQGVETSSGFIPASAVVLAIGHSARDTYRSLLAGGVPLEAKAFQLGLRIEHPQEQIDNHKYGSPRDRQILGAADYTLQARGQRDLFTFCMCAGGYIIPSVSQPEQFCTNGMSNSRHDTRFANSGLVVTVEPHEFDRVHPLAGMELQEKYESQAYLVGERNYLVPIQTARDFVAGRGARHGEKLVCSYKRGSVNADLAQVLPPAVVQAIRGGLPIMDEKWRGNYLKNAILVGPEMRGSSPIRIPRDPQSREMPNISGLFPVGEGAGYAGGIISAAVDGLRTAKAIVARYAPLESRL